MNANFLIFLIFISMGLTISSTPVAADPAMKTYSNLQYGFSITYPADLVVITSPEALRDNVFHNHILLTDVMPVVRFELPDNSLESGIAGALEIDVGGSASALRSCLAVTDPNEQTMTVSHVGLISVKNIGDAFDVNFVTYNYVAAAGSSRNSVTSYAAIHARNDSPLCYQMNIIQTGNGYEAGPDITPAKSAYEAKTYGLPFGPLDVFTRLMPLVETFQFAPNE